MLNPIVTQYIIADRTAEARQHADRARLVRQAVTGAAQARAAGQSGPSRTPARWRAWGWSLTPRAFGSARLLLR
jgi:hypothetical protein